MPITEWEKYIYQIRLKTISRNKRDSRELTALLWETIPLNSILIYQRFHPILISLCLRQIWMEILEHCSWIAKEIIQIWKCPDILNMWDIHIKCENIVNQSNQKALKCQSVNILRLFTMQEKGLEPSRHCCHRHLKPARLPIPPFLHK